MTWDIKAYGPPIDKKVRNRVIQTAIDVYRKLSGDPTKKLNLILISDSNAVEEYQEEITEKITHEYGLKAAAFGLSASITHHAFFGPPTIVIKINEITNEDNIWMAELQTAVAHAILHGAPEYYIIKINPSFGELEQTHHYRRLVLSAVYYILATAVKSFEVTRLLGMNNFIEDQIRMMHKNMQITVDEERLWKASEQNVNVKLLLFSNSIKGLAPFSALRIFTHDIPESLIKLYQENLELMDEPWKSLTDKIVNDVFPRLGHDTLVNLSNVTSIIAQSV